MRRARAFPFLLLAALLAAGPAVAVSVSVGIEGGETVDLVGHGVASDLDGDGVVDWVLTYDYIAEGYTVTDWTVRLKEDPFVTNNITLTNTGPATATFTATVLLPIPGGFAYNKVIASSVGVTVTDSDTTTPMLFDTDTLGTPIYQGFVNFPASTTLLSLNPIFPGTLPIDTTDCFPPTGPGCTATSSNGVALLAVTPGVASFIGITLTFQLSSGDSAGITSRFEIVPEPAAALLLGAGLIALAVLRRRA